MCADARDQSQNKREWAWALLFPVAAVVMIRSVRYHEPGWILLNLWLVMVWRVVLIPLHELGHAMAARAVGSKVFFIVIGSGAKVFERRIRGAKVQLNRFPWMGMTGAAHPEATSPRFVRFVTVAGGLLVNALLLSAILAFRPWKELVHPSWVNGLRLIESFAVANVLILVSNLLPRRIGAEPAGLVTDGWGLWKALFPKPHELDSFKSDYYLLEGLMCAEGKRWDEARSWLERGLHVAPRSENLRTWLGVALLELGDHEGARREFLMLLDTPALQPHQRATVLNNVAWSNVLTERPDLLDEADRLSGEAYRMIGWHPALKGTRGAVLIERGQLAEGRTLVEEAIRVNREPAWKASNACYLALAAHKMGDAESARRHLDLAQQLDPHCSLLGRMRKRLEQPGGPVTETRPPGDRSPTA